MGAVTGQMAAVSLGGNFRIEVKDGNSKGGYYLGYSPDGKRITGNGTRYYTEGKYKGDRYEGDLIDDIIHGKGMPVSLHSLLSLLFLSPRVSAAILSPLSLCSVDS